MGLKILVLAVLLSFGSLSCSEESGSGVLGAPVFRAQSNVESQVMSSYVFDPVLPKDSFIGVSHIAHEPSLDNQTLDFGVATLLRLNVKSAFFYLTPEYKIRYLQQDFGPSHPKTLAELADLAPYRRAFSAFDNIVLTCAVDAFSTIGLSIRDHYLTDAEYAANRKEFFELTSYLMRTYKGTNKRFILKNWEGDWLLLNGYDANAEVPDSRVTNFVRWFRSTQEGISAARELPANQSDVKVDFALEMNLIGIVQAGKRNTFLGSVVPQVPSDWVAYSAWESISNRGQSREPDDIYRAVVNDLEDIRRRAGRPIFVSEFAYPESDHRPGLQGEQVRAALRGFKDAGIPLAFYWNTYEKPYGLYRTDGSLFPNEAFDALRGESMKIELDDPQFFVSGQARNVASAYWEVLGRKPEKGGFEYWAAHRASQDRAAIRKIVVQSDEAARNVREIYRKYRGSAPEEETTREILAAIEKGGTLFDIAAAMYLAGLGGAGTTGFPFPIVPPRDNTPAKPRSGCVGESLKPGFGLEVGQWLCSADGRFLLSMQQDGNLVLYQGQKVIWASNTARDGVTSAQFQNDGNLVIYAGPNSVWASNTGGTSADALVMQSDGNLVIYKSGTAIWASETGGR